MDIAESIFGRTPLFMACELGKFDLPNSHQLARILVANRADVNKATRSGETPLYIAAKEGDIDIVKLLVESGAVVDQKVIWNDKTPRAAAREAGHDDVVKWLDDYEEKRAAQEIRALQLGNRVAHNRDLSLPILHDDAVTMIRQNLFSKK